MRVSPFALGVIAVIGAGAGPLTAAPVAAAAPSAVAVTISATSCRVAPARVVAGEVRFTISNRSPVAQRFAIAGRSSARVRPAGRLGYRAVLDEPVLYPYRCIPNRGPTRRGSLRVARNVVVESDMDASDAMALLYLLGRADVEVSAIVVDGDGEARCPAGAANALALLALAGRPDVPVGCGRPLPLRGAHAFPTVWRDYVDNFFGLPRPSTPGRRGSVGSGETVFRDAIRSAPGRVDVLTLGPPTELAAVLAADATIGGRIRSVTMMGGAVGVPGNMTWPLGLGNQYAEWNFWVDPHAVNVVFRSGVAITLVPLDATNAVPLNGAVAARLGGSPSAAFVRRLIESLLPSSTLYFWDPFAAAALAEPVVGSYAERRLAVVEGEGPDCGRVVEATDGGRVRVTISGDRARFEDSFALALR